MIKVKRARATIALCEAGRASHLWVIMEESEAAHDGATSIASMLQSSRVLRAPRKAILQTAST